MALIALFTQNSCKVGRFVVYNYADIDDHKKFPARNIETGTTKFIFPVAETGKEPKELHLKDKSHPFEQYLEDNKTVAFLIIKNDTVQYEKYWDKYDASSTVPSFSMAKSITGHVLLRHQSAEGNQENEAEIRTRRKV
ncbi:hypothetical protein [Pedobacter sp. BAL39]|uniref:hypothetical protein n=1 Tax=Pedobacter sp. BAL39 TaxID=391596 RepID=UPI0018DE9E3D|nr:hypothetical protein [Pedobacter sp. BAL39]